MAKLLLDLTRTFCCKLCTFADNFTFYVHILVLNFTHFYLPTVRNAKITESARTARPLQFTSKYLRANKKRAPGRTRTEQPSAYEADALNQLCYGGECRPRVESNHCLPAYKGDCTAIVLQGRN